MSVKHEKYPEELKLLLQKVHFLQILNEHELHLLIAYSEIFNFSKDEFILRQGKKNDGIYIIISGNATAAARILGEGLTSIASLDEGSILGEISLIDHGLCATSVITNTPVKCIYIPRAYFEMLARIYPDTHHKIYAALAKEILTHLSSLHAKISALLLKSQTETNKTVFTEFESAEQLDFDEIHVNKSQIHAAEIFKSLPENIFKHLLKYTIPYLVPKHTTLIKPGETSPIIFIILRGAIQSNVAQQNIISKLSVLGPMNIICSASLFVPFAPSLIFYETCEKSILLKLEEKALHKIQTEHLELWYHLFNIITKSIAQTERSMDKLAVRLNSEIYRTR